MPATRARPYLIGLAIAAALLAVFFGSVLWGGQSYYAGDIARIYHPQRVALSQTLAQGRLPWWTPEVGIGYPMLAEGEIGALYPLNWPLYAMLSPERALSLSIVLHYLLAGLGLYWLGRTLGMARAGALLGGVIYALGGFNIAHLSHISILSAAAWLPWLLACTHRLLAPAEGMERAVVPREPDEAHGEGGARANTRFAPTRGWAWPWALALAALTALQFLAGHPQIALLNLLAVGLAGLWWSCGRLGRASVLRAPAAPPDAGIVGAAPRGCPSTGSLHWPWAALALWAGALALGALLALPQLLPAAELSGLSQRAGGLEGPFFTSYSFHPLLAATFASPFLQGPPHPEGSIELMGYLGLLPLALAWRALWQPRARGVWLWVALVALGLFMALGRWNPLYALLSYVPVLNLFRVPARYLLWTSLGLAILAGWGLDRLLGRAAPRADRLGLGLAGVTLAALAVVAALALTATGLDDLAARWRWIPLALALATTALLLAARRLPRPLLAALALLAVSVDLYAYGAVLGQSYNQTMPSAQVRQAPRALAILQAEDGLHRSYTKPEILPILSVQREALYPNIALAYGVSSANVYLPLVPQGYQDYLDGLDAERLSRLNVRYYLIPQLLPVDEASELYDVLNPYAAIPYGWRHPIEARGIVAIEVESYVSHAADAPDGRLAAEVLLERCEGEALRLPLRVGLETAEWAYARSDVATNVQHGLPSIATTFAARSGFPPEDHPGYTYLASWELSAATDLCGLRIEPAMPEAFVRIERIRLIAQDGATLLAAHLLGLGDHSILYRSEDALVYENHDVLPRAYALPLAGVTLSEGEARLPQGSLRAMLIPAEIVSYGAQEIVIAVAVDQSALLVLADLHYPGWQATVDGQPAEILAADGVFRAIVLAPGAHQVRLVYPRPW
jgi:hypothetical protein